MFRRWLSILLLLALTSCAHNVYLQGRATGATGYARVVGPGSGGEITIDLGGTPYKGRWVYMANGGGVGIGTAAAFSGGRSATAIGTFSALPAQGNVSIFAHSAGGAQLHCVADWNSMSGTGIGVCQDSKGEVYDLQIN